jgi:hypothetical protein
MLGSKKDELYKIGDEMDFWCSKCRLNLHGTVAALTDGGKVAKVTCNTCRFTVPYKDERTEAEIRGKLLKRALSMRDRRQQRQGDAEAARAPSGGSDITQRWRKLTEDVNSTRAALYGPEKSFKLGDSLIHRQHGLGIVTQVLHENAFVAIFRNVEVPLEMNGEKLPRGEE